MEVFGLVACAVTVSILIGYVYQKLKHRDCVSERRLDGKTVLVTGGTAGMGLEVACALARRGARVLVAGPYPHEGETARRRVAINCDAAHVRYLPLDLSDSTSTRRVAADILRTESRLDILVNNAGVGGPFDTVTGDGMNYVMQVNYFGPVLLTMLLLPLLKKCGTPGDPSRIVNVASGLHLLGKVDIDDLKSGNYRMFQTEIYGNSKLCVVMFTRELARRLRGENVVVNSLEPGTVGTKIFNSWSSHIGFIVTWIVGLICKTPWQGAQTTLHVAVDEAAGRVSGEYFAECCVSPPAAVVYDDSLLASLWEETMKLIHFSAEK